MDNLVQPENNYQSDASRWQAILERDSGADGAFTYGVVTTRIYCRPGCASRRPNRENVRFFDTPRSAEAAGFRPCKRCRPLDAEAKDPGVDAVAAACRIMDQADKAPILKELAEAVGLSPYYFHRLFKKTTGITPKQYAQGVRLDRVRENLAGNSTVTEAIYESGYGSSSRFYEKARESLGMRPNDYRQGGAGLQIRYGMADSSLGWVLVAVTDEGVCRIDFGEGPKELATRLETTFPRAEVIDDQVGIQSVLNQTLDFIETPKALFDLPLDIQGTVFQRRVWAALRGIPPGQTASYGEIALQIGSPKAARAVAQACASNNLAVAVPCHRVVRADGGLGGYRWGLERKRALLEREQRIK